MVNLVSGRGKAITFPFPETVQEISLKSFIEFEIAYTKKMQWLEGLEETPIETARFMVGYIKHTIEVLNCFIPPEHVIEVPIGNFKRHLVKLMGARDIREIDLEGVKDTLLGLYSQVFPLVKEYQPRSFVDTDFVFEHKGQVFTIGRAYKDVITQQERFSSLPAGQVVEALEGWKAYEENQAKDENGSFLYSSILKLIACLATSPGQPFPTSELEVQRYINERILFFQDIDMGTALDVKAFFLLTTKV